MALRTHTKTHNRGKRLLIKQDRISKRRLLYLHHCSIKIVFCCQN